MDKIIDQSFMAKVRRLFKNRLQAENDFLRVERSILKELAQESLPNNRTVDPNAKKARKGSPSHARKSL